MDNSPLVLKRYRLLKPGSAPFSKGSLDSPCFEGHLHSLPSCHCWSCRAVAILLWSPSFSSIEAQGLIVISLRDYSRKWRSAAFLCP